MTPDALVEQLKAALSELDKAQVTAVCSGLVEELSELTEPFPAKQARSILTLLRSKRYFEEMCRVGAALSENGQRDAKTRRLYAQGLIDSHQLSTALEFLQGVVSDTETSSRELAEAWGLIGRVHKQSYVDTPDASSDEKEQTLGDAIEAYHRIYDADPEKLWHGINVVALLARAKRDEVAVPVDKSLRRMAETIRDVVEEREEDGDANIWDYGTAMEASIALRDAPAAIEWAEKYVRVGLTGPADEFEFGATHRQLQEVWQATPDDFMGKSIIPLLEGAILDLGMHSADGSGSFSITPANAARLQSGETFDGLERVFGADSFKRIGWIRMLNERLTVIGLVSTRAGNGVGTGFMVHGSYLSNELDDDWYFLTNSHVVTNDEEVIASAPAQRRPLMPKEAFITFEVLFENTPRQFAVEELIWTSPPHALDATLLKLDKPFYEVVEPYPICEDELPLPEDKPRLYIAGHPGGRGLTISLQDNHLIQSDARLMHYRTPTEPGSSGSPVFNEQWELLGLHHAGDRKMKSLDDSGDAHEANEGIRVTAIMEALNAFLRRERGETPQANA